MLRRQRIAAPEGVFIGSHAIADHMITPKQLHSNLYRRLFQDVFIPAGIPVTHAVRCQGAALIAPAEAVVTGRSAATLYGVELARAHDPVELTVPEEHRFYPVRGIKLHRGPVKKSEFRPWMGIRLATPTRMGLEVLTRHAPRNLSQHGRLRIAVADLDQLLRAGVVDLAELADVVQKRRDHGIVLARQAVLLADPRAESPPESELRVVLTLAGLAPEPQITVYDQDGFVGRVDLGYRLQKVAVEYDGRWHNQPEQIALDELRRARLRAAGWQVIVVRHEALQDDLDGIVTAVRSALRAFR
jgi:hypothetical protein